jgi:hypothetical protein
MRPMLLALLLLITVPAMATRYLGASVGSGGLSLHTDGGNQSAPYLDHAQQGFADPWPSPDGRMVGWLVLERTCCESYPLPTSLVLFRDGRVVRRISDGLVILAWSFARNGKAVAYRESTAHFETAIVYKLRRVADGHVLDEFACEAKPGKPWTFHGKVPDWVWPIVGDCPGK